MYGARDDSEEISQQYEVSAMVRWKRAEKKVGRAEKKME